MTNPTRAGVRVNDATAFTSQRPADRSEYNVDMFWIGTALTLVAVMVVVAVILAKRQAADHDGKRAVADLGSVSTSWITEHRTER